MLILFYFFISSKYDFHVDAERMIAKSWEMSRIICVDLKKKNLWHEKYSVPNPLLR